MALSNQSKNRDVLGDGLAIVEDQHGHSALGIECGIIVAALRDLRPEVHALELRLKSGFVKRNTRREAARAGRIIKLHPHAPIGSKGCAGASSGQAQARVACSAWRASARGSATSQASLIRASLPDPGREPCR